MEKILAVLAFGRAFFLTTLSKNCVALIVTRHVEFVVSLSLEFGLTEYC